MERHSRESGNPELLDWIPVFAGMTVVGKPAERLRTVKINKGKTFVVIVWAALSLGFADGGSWQKTGAGILEPQINFILPDPQNPEIIYVGTTKALYISTDHGRRFRPSLQLQGSGKGINYIYKTSNRLDPRLRGDDKVEGHSRESVPMGTIPASSSAKADPLSGKIESSKESRIGNPEALNDSSEVYAATDSGLYMSANQGKNWQNIFNPSEMKARQVLSVLKDDNVFYAGTLDGLYRKYPNSPNWQRESGDLGNTPIYEILIDEKYYYFANDRRLFRKSKDNSEVKVIFDAGLTRNEDEFIEEEAAAPPRQIKDLVLTAGFLIVANDGISYSQDEGETWKSLPIAGLPMETVTSLAIFNNDTSVIPAEAGIHEENKVSHGKAGLLPGDLSTLEGGFGIYAGTTRGVFQLNGNRWNHLYKGIEANSILALTHDNQGTLYAATDSGIFVMAPVGHPREGVPMGTIPASARIGSSKESRIGDPGILDSRQEHSGMTKKGEQAVIAISDVSNDFSHEPTIQEVQRLAIDYAEVHPDKINQWRSAAKRRAILPTLSVGLDREAGEFFHWDTGPNPDTLSKGRDFLSWDVTVAWDLGDLIWNPDQTSIDSRSKLMVELREDIMDQVTRLYFERRRVQMEMALAPESDPQSQMDDELRLAELTALIDALTGGKFSERIEKWKSQGAL